MVIDDQERGEEKNILASFALQMDFGEELVMAEDFAFSLKCVGMKVENHASQML